MNDTVVLEGEFGLFMDTGQETVVESLNVTENGTYTAGSGVDGYSPVTVNVPTPEPVTESLSVTANGTYTPEQGVDGFDSVSVAVPATVPVISSLTVSEDGTYTTPSGTDGYSPVTVNTGVAALQAEIESAETISGCDPLVSGLTVLVTYSNETTGESDTTLSDAVATLASGYGGGSGTDYLPMFLNDALIEYSSDEITELPTSAFQSKSIQRITLPNVTSLPNYAFRYTKLKGIYANDFPSLTASGGWGFQGCTDLEFVVLKSCNNIPISSFSICTSLTILDIGNPTLNGYSLQNNSLNGASALNKIVLRFNNVLPIQNLNAFTGTPFSSDGAGGTIYVPQSLVSSYREDSSWSTVLGYNANNQILSIEGSIYETQYADGTAITA